MAISLEIGGELFGKPFNQKMIRDVKFDDMASTSPFMDMIRYMSGGRMP